MRKNGVQSLASACNGRGFEYGKAPQVSGVFRLVRYALPKSLLRMNLAPAYANPESLNADRISRYHSLLLLPGQRDAMLDRMAQTILTDPVPKLQKINARPYYCGVNKMR